MFAIIKTGGKQYKVAPNDIIKVEKLASAMGDLVEFSDVLMTGQGNSIKIGAPLITNAKVFGTVLHQIRDDKVIVFKKKRRHNYRRKNGHRQYLTVVQITDIFPEGGTPKTKAPSVKIEAKTKEPTKKAPPKVEAKSEKPAKKTAPKTETKAVKTVTKAKATKPITKATPKTAGTAKKTVTKAKKPSKE